MTIPFTIAVKSFLGLFAITPFEDDLLKRLSEGMEPGDREVLASQLACFTTVRRLTRHIDEPKAHGFTNFYTLRHGKDISSERQTKRFASGESEAVLAIAHVIFDGGEIAAQFWLVRGVLFSIEYRSPQKIYYPPGEYRIDSLQVWPKAESSA